MADANVIFVNHVGGSSEIVYDGSSAMFNAEGKAVALLGSFVEEIAFVDTDNTRNTVEVPYQDKVANVYGALKLGIADYFDKGKADKKACIVLTGGIDSSVAAAILVDALGEDRVVALQMPSRYSTDHSAEEAEALAKALGIELVTIPLSEIYASALDTIVSAIGPSWRLISSCACAPHSLWRYVRNVAWCPSIVPIRPSWPWEPSRSMVTRAV